MIAASANFASHNHADNRLMYYEVRDGQGQLAQRVDYTSNRAGNPYYIITTYPGDPAS